MKMGIGKSKKKFKTRIAKIIKIIENFNITYF